MEKSMNFGDVAYQQVYNSTDWEVIIRTGWRPPTPRRIALCRDEGDAEAICTALIHAINTGIVA